MADWSAPTGMERITSILLVGLPEIAMQARLDAFKKLLEGRSNKDCKDWYGKHEGCSSQPLRTVPVAMQPGSMEGQLGALRRVCFGELGFVEQLDALDDEKKLL